MKSPKTYQHSELCGLFIAIAYCKTTSIHAWPCVLTPNAGAPWGQCAVQGRVDEAFMDNNATLLAELEAKLPDSHLIGSGPHDDKGSRRLCAAVGATVVVVIAVHCCWLRNSRVEWHIIICTPCDRTEEMLWPLASARHHESHCPLQGLPVAPVTMSAVAVVTHVRTCITSSRWKDL
eukprot:scaffold66220_cov37-Prasinocladus_malaysianus.AAC.1